MKSRNSFNTQEKDYEFFEELSKQLFKKYKKPLIICVSVFAVLISIPIIGSWIVPFYCNESKKQSFMELFLVIFVYGLLLPVIGNILFISWKLSNCEKFIKRIN